MKPSGGAEWSGQPAYDPNVRTPEEYRGPAFHPGHHLPNGNPSPQASIILFASNFTAKQMHRMHQECKMLYLYLSIVVLKWKIMVNVTGRHQFGDYIILCQDTVTGSPHKHALKNWLEIH